MPQLDPAPWLMVMSYSWIMMLTLVPSKVKAHTLPNEPVSLSSHDIKMDSWLWPW